MALDDIFNEQELNLERLRSEERQLKRLIFIIAAISLIVWGYIAYMERGIDIGFFVGMSLVLVFAPLIGALVLTTFIALFPYRGFNYQQRFFRYFLIVLMLLYIMINTLAFLGVVQEW